MPDSDLLSELRDAIISQIQRQSRYFHARRAIELPPQVTAPLNPLAASVVPGNETPFATGYSGGVTTVPFTWGLSLWGGGDIWTG